ncbi:MAG: hypothetical protein KDN20_06605 [Verrucomicrobiae bacterium]|nr:hypothetical protein [Verrucomicrobiae bacterium]
MPSLPKKIEPGYIRPPIYERVAVFKVDLPEEKFEIFRDSWLELVSEDFPDYKPEPLWTFSVESNDSGIPRLRNSRPELQIKHWSRKTLENGKGRNVIRVRPNDEGDSGFLSINLIGSTKDRRKYDQLRDLAEKWLPRFIAHFEIDDLEGVGLHYVNRIRSDWTPEFASIEKGVDIGRVIVLFGSIPVQSESLIAPFDCNVGLMIDSSVPCSAKIRVLAEEPVYDEKTGHQKLSIGVKVDIIVSRFSKERKLDAKDAISDMDAAHSVVLEVFEGIFSEEAKEVFRTQAPSK